MSQPSSDNPRPNTRSQTSARTLSHEGNDDNPSRSSTARPKVSSGQVRERDPHATHNRGENEAAGTHTPPLLPTPGPTDTPTPAQEVRPANPGNPPAIDSEGGRRQQNASRDVAQEARTADPGNAANVDAEGERGQQNASRGAAQEAGEGDPGNLADIDAEGGRRQQNASRDAAQEARPGHTNNAPDINVEDERRQQNLARDAAQEKKRAKRSLEISRARLRLMEEEDEYKNRFPESDEE